MMTRKLELLGCLLLLCTGSPQALELHRQPSFLQG